MAWTGSWGKGLSFDEGLQLATGYNIWLNHDYRIEGANGDLIKRWATLPYLITRPRFVSHEDRVWQQSSAYELGRRFLFELGNSPEALLWQGRAMVSLLGAAAGLLVFLASRRLFGWWGGLLSLGLFAFSPEMLAFGGVVSTDMSITLTLFAATWCLWRLLHEITWPRLAASLLTVALTVLAKPTALVLFPLSAVLVGTRLWRGKPWRICWCSLQRTLVRRRSQFGVSVFLALLHIAAGWGALWAHYGFRYAASPNPADPALQFSGVVARDEVPPVLDFLIQKMKSTHFLPEGFLVGVDTLLANDDRMGSFMNGRWRVGGSWAFFPYTVWVKTHPSLLVLLLLAAAVWWRARRRGDPAAPSLYVLTPHLALVACYLAVAMTEDLNLGHRHILPIYLPLLVLAGAVSLGWQRHGALFRAVVVALPLWLAGESLAIRPHYLAYFGPQAGGSSMGYRRLVDSSLDWGMNLPELRDWLDQHDRHQHVPLYLAYFGTDSPRHYGIRSYRLPGFFDRRRFGLRILGPGYYAISASLFQGVYTAAFGPWSRQYEARYQEAMRNAELYAAAGLDPAKGKALFARAPVEFWMREIDAFDNLRFARLCAWLRQRGLPPMQIGYGIFLWQLDMPALQEALLGPPPELVENSPQVRQFRQLVLSRL